MNIYEIKWTRDGMLCKAAVIAEDATHAVGELNEDIMEELEVTLIAEAVRLEKRRTIAVETP